MKLECFCIKDDKSEGYRSPMFLQTRGEAIRAFTDEVNSSKSQIGLHPGDFSIFHIGTFDPFTGHLTGCTPVHLGNGLDFKRKLEAPVM